MLKKNKMLIILILLAILSIILYGKISLIERSNTYDVKNYHYRGRYNVIQKDLESDKEVGYVLTDGLVTPFYKNKYYFELSFDFSYQTNKVINYNDMNDSKAIIPISKFDKNSKFIVELYDNLTNKKIKEVNIYPIIKDKVKGLYFLDGFSDAYLSKEGKDLIFNLPIKSNLLLTKNKGNKYLSIMKINLINNKVTLNKDCMNFDNDLYSQSLVRKVYKNKLVSDNIIYIENYGEISQNNKDKNTYVVLDSVAYKNNKKSSMILDKFPKLKKYLDNVKENKLLVFYFKEKNTKLEKEIMNINK